jgi:hypothetical protein
MKLIFFLALLGLGAPPQDVSTLQVSVHYSGSGKVDEKHKIYVVLWDSPTFAKGEQITPVEIKPLTSNLGYITFSNVRKSPVYVSAAFDPTGSWDPQSGPPPNGSSLGLYSKAPNKPEPIDVKSGKTVTVEVTFDDRFKMQSGKPNR